jgi:hypothetical protein
MTIHRHASKDPMNQFSQHIAQLKSYAARPEIAPIILMLGMLPAIALFTLAGAQMMTSMFSGMGVSMLLVGPLLTAAAGAKANPRRAALIGAALIAYACGIHIAIHQLGLAIAPAVVFDKLAGSIFLMGGVAVAIVHTLWRALRT